MALPPMVRRAWVWGGGGGGQRSAKMANPANTAAMAGPAPVALHPHRDASAKGGTA
jgi:hypothetical protein